MGILKAEAATANTRGRSTRVSLLSVSAFELEKELSASLSSEKGRE